MNNYNYLSASPTLFLKYKKDDLYYILVNWLNTDIFIKITDKLCKNYDDNSLEHIVLNNLIETGTDNFVLGQDYFIGNNDSEEEIYMPIFDVFNHASYDVLINLSNKDINNIGFFIFKNLLVLSDNIYTDEELNALNSTFMKIINDKNQFNDVLTGNNLVYKYVIDYYMNNQMDDALIAMNAVFNTTLSTTVQTPCGCNSNVSGNCANTANADSLLNTGTDLVNYDSATCIDKYKAAMFEWLKQMLSDVNFYCEWMSISNDGDNAANDELIDALIELLTELLNSNIDLSSLGNNSGNCKLHKSGYGNYEYACGDNLNDSMNNSNACSNYSIIQNYIKVLEYVKNGEIDENKNKIYIYGKQFAEIFPLLSF